MADRSRKGSEKTFRLRGIPGGYAKDGVRQLVHETVLRDESEVPVKICSLAWDPYRRNMKSATLEFSTLPRSLSNNVSNEEWTFEGNDGVCVVLDCNFKGFTALHTPDDSECSME